MAQEQYENESMKLLQEKSPFVFKSPDKIPDPVHDSHQSVSNAVRPAPDLYGSEFFNNRPFLDMNGG